MDNNFNNKFISGDADTVANNLPERKFRIIPGGRPQLSEAEVIAQVFDLERLSPNMIETIVQYLRAEVCSAEQNVNENSSNFASINFDGAMFNLGRFVHLINEVAAAFISKPFFESNNKPMYQPEPRGRILQEESKKSFLVFKNNKYLNVQTEKIAFVYVRNESSTIMTLQQEEYPIVPSLDQVQSLVCAKQFFRLNRQYLINFDAIKEVEHYFARKLLVKLLIPSPETLLISKEKTSSFLKWMENR